ncbi:BTAD domain-containing putative transcriptional regulator [Dactylosporangium sp. NPDC049525]|uniref:AfsR/SARP family transcriptional regulator n=1 Tax=Dactylosporangium sp. NPDC049525 TaxID=3154730 RepID=UPI00343E9BF4
MGDILFRLLGDVTARDHEGAAVDLGHDRQRCVLAVLLVAAGRAVPADTLMERAWGERLPRRPKDALYSYISRLRHVLAPTGATLERQRAGYLIRVDPLAVDLHRFDDLVRQARAAADDRQALDLVEEALALCAGEPFGALDTPWLNAVRDERDRSRRRAERERDELVLRVGGHAVVVDRLVARAAQDPLDEALAGQALVALYRCGRSAEALAHYDRVRRRLAEELGTEPGAALRCLYERILRADPELAGPEPPANQRPDPQPEPRPAPRQLPPPPGSFVGRARQLAELSAALAPAAGAGPAVAISAIGGPGGVGKTWLALRWAHEHQHRYPDGQLYVNLRGFDPSGEPVDPAAAIRSLLEGLGVPGYALPADADSRAALYRSLVAGRRMLVVLDNARDTAQVVPLLPGAPGCAVLVTSRRRLTGLVATYGARPVRLDVMSDAEARALLRARLGESRLAAEPAALDALLPHCAGLPLALGIVAARMATGTPGDRPGGLAALAAELHDRRARLDALDTGELTLSLRAVMDSSVRALSGPAERVLCRLGQAPGPDIGIAALSALDGTAPEALRPALRELIDANLLTEDPPGRYRMHDLVRLYADERAAAGDEAGRHAALERLLDHYLHTAYAADRRLQPLRPPIALAPAVADARVAAPVGRRAALAWFAAERHTLPAAVRHAAANGFDRHTWQLAWALLYLFDQRGDWQDQVDVHRVALCSARRLADDRGQAHAHLGAARGYTWLGRFDEAREHLGRALTAFERLDDRIGQGTARRGLARVSARQGQPRRALDDDHRALELFAAAGHEYGLAQVLNAIGWHHAHLGEHDHAADWCRRAIAIQQRIGDRVGEGMTWDSLAYIRRGDRRHRDAVDCYRRSAQLLHDAADGYYEAVVTEHLGDVHAELGDAEAARAAWRHSACLLTALGHPHAAGLHTKLAVRGGPPLRRPVESKI